MIYHLFFGSEASLEYTPNLNLGSEDGLGAGYQFGGGCPFFQKMVIRDW